MAVTRESLIPKVAVLTMDQHHLFTWVHKWSRFSETGLSVIIMAFLCRSLGINQVKMGFKVWMATTSTRVKLQIATWAQYSSIQSLIFVYMANSNLFFPCCPGLHATVIVILCVVEWHNSPASTLANIRLSSNWTSCPINQPKLSNTRYDCMRKRHYSEHSHAEPKYCGNSQTLVPIFLLTKAE